MSRRKQVEAEQAVILAARELVRRLGNPIYDDEKVLFRAVRTLDTLAPSNGFNGPGSFVQGSPGTSRAAAISATPILRSARRQIVNEIASVSSLWPTGLSDEDLCRRLRRHHKTVSSARNWLCEKGWLTDSGARKKSASGRATILWCLTPAAQSRVHSPEWLTSMARENA